MRTPLPDWPVFGFVDDVRPALDQVRSRGQPAVLATLVAVEGGGVQRSELNMLGRRGGCLEERF
jgi:xanthine dehydrogenase accessory factor